MGFLRKFFPYSMRAYIKDLTSLAPDERSCHTACEGKRRAKPALERRAHSPLIDTLGNSRKGRASS